MLSYEPGVGHELVMNRCNQKISVDTQKMSQLWNIACMTHQKKVHYENTPIQIYRKFHIQKLRIFQIKNNFDIFHTSDQNIDCGYSLEPPRRGGSNEYP